MHSHILPLYTHNNHTYTHAHGFSCLRGVCCCCVDLRVGVRIVNAVTRATGGDCHASPICTRCAAGGHVSLSPVRFFAGSSKTVRPHWLTQGHARHRTRTQSGLCRARTHMPAAAATVGTYGRQKKVKTLSQIEGHLRLQSHGKSSKQALISSQFAGCELSGVVQILEEDPVNAEAKYLRTTMRIAIRSSNTKRIFVQLPPQADAHTHMHIHTQFHSN